MKFLLATTKGGEEDTVSPVFGRCATFTIVNTEDDKIKNVTVEKNPYASGTGGVGIQVAQYAVDQKVNAVFAGQFGPNATDVLKAAGIDMVAVAGISVKDAVLGYMKGGLKPSSPGGVGVRGSTAPPPVGFRAGYGRDGRRMGRGSGRGGGRRAGMGPGRGYHRGLCRWWMASYPPLNPAYSYGSEPQYLEEHTTDKDLTGEPTLEQELEFLKNETANLEKRLANIKNQIKAQNDRIKDIHKTNRNR